MVNPVQSRRNHYGCVLIAGQVPMTPDTASEYIADIKRFLSARSDEDLASALNIGKSTIASWRRRGSIPASFVDNFNEKYGSDWRRKPSADDFGGRLVDAVGRDMLFLAVLRLGKETNRNIDPDWASWLGKNEGEVRRRLCEQAGLNNRSVLDPQVVTNLVIRMVQGDLATGEHLQAARTAMANASDTTDLP